MFGGIDTYGKNLNTLYELTGNLDATPTKSGFHYISILYLHAVFMWLGWGVNQTKIYKIYHLLFFL